MELLLPFAGFILVSTITPGPNNFLLAASGIRFGVWKTVPHIIGIQCGMYSLVILCGLGLGQLLLASPIAITALKIFGSVYLVYLAWKILGFRSTTSASGDIDQPMGIVEAGIFQFSNPKAWMMVTTGLNISFAFNSNTIAAIVILCSGFATLGLVCNFAWAWMGSSLSKFLQDPVYRFWINGGLALITIATVIMFWII